MHDGAFFTAGPTVQGIGKGQPEQRHVRHGALFFPRESTVRSMVRHATLSHDPSGFGIGESDSKQIREPRAGP